MKELDRKQEQQGGKLVGRELFKKAEKHAIEERAGGDRSGRREREREKEIEREREVEEMRNRTRRKKHEEERRGQQIM